MADSDTNAKSIQENLIKTRIGLDLTEKMEDEAKNTFPVILEFNIKFPGGSTLARLLTLSAYLGRNAETGSEAAAEIETALQRHLAMHGAHYQEFKKEIAKAFSPADRIAVSNSLWTENYAFGTLHRSTINQLAGITFSENKGRGQRKVTEPLVYKIWFDHDIKANLFESCRTIKSDAARAAFAAAGEGIVWAVVDTGVDARHPHFLTRMTLELADGLRHHDFTNADASDSDSAASALTDQDGHGTHVAGILAGETALRSKSASRTAKEAAKTIMVRSDERTQDGGVVPVERAHSDPITGIAPACKIISLKVLADRDTGSLSNLVAALAYIQHLNNNGRNLRVHGVNLSLGYPFNPEWFAAGRSPLCVEVDRLVRSGVVVVAAAGNGGYGTVTTYTGTSERASHAGTIGDPGNADLAITVGSTHRNKPHAYGVSYFSAKGPTADGRMKPDLVAPGERIISCALFDKGDEKKNIAPYREDSGTSMAAPHVSGAIAAFLSVRGEFVGEPERVKQIFLDSATDLKRRAEYQGAGLIDLMRALQSV